MIDQSAIVISSEVHVYRFKLPEGCPAMPTIPGLYGHWTTPSPMIVPKSGKVQLRRDGEVNSVELVGKRTDTDQRDTTIWTRDDLASADYHGIPGHVLVTAIVGRARDHHTATIRAERN